MEATGVGTFVVEMILNGQTKRVRFNLKPTVTIESVKAKMRSAFNVANGTLSSNMQEVDIVDELVAGGVYYFVEFTPLPVQGSGSCIYQVSFKCEKSRNFKGFRASCYLNCADFCGYFDASEENSFHYSSDGDLQISVLFESEDNARKFINSVIESCLYHTIPFQHNMVTLPNRADLNLPPVFLSHYYRISDEGED